MSDLSSAPINSENLVKIGRVLSEIFGWKSILAIVPKVAINHPRNLRVTGPVYTIYRNHCHLILLIGIAFSKPFWNADATKLVAMATSFERLGKRVRSIIYDQIPTIW